MREKQAESAEDKMREVDGANALKWAKARLKTAGITSYSLDALVLLSHATGKTKEWLLSHDYFLCAEENSAFFTYIEMRAKSKPVQYIINKCEFMGLEFYVDESVLIPRADTELLAERALESANKFKRPRILDLCTGSGCVAVSLSRHCPAANVTGADISVRAVEIAAKNAAQNGVSGRVSFIASDLFGALEAQKFDIITANPPYIPENEIGTLPPSVRSYEPVTALNGGERGTEFYKRIAEDAKTRLNTGGFLLFEAGFGQMPEIVEIMNRNGYNNISIYRDLAGIERVIEGKQDV